MSSPRFGVSTHLYHDQRLDRDHLVEIAAHGFDCIELFATRTHFDYHDSVAGRAAGRVARRHAADAATRCTRRSAPASSTAQWGETFSNAIADDERRRKALAEAEAALAIAQTIPYRASRRASRRARTSLKPAAVGQQPRRRAAQRRRAARDGRAGRRATGARSHSQRAVDARKRSSRSSRTTSRARRSASAWTSATRFLMGDLGDAIEACSGHLVTTHLHDNRGKTDDHLTPGEGTIDWPATLMSLQKIGYDGTWMFEVANTSTPESRAREDATRRAATVRDAARSELREPEAPRAGTSALDVGTRTQ